MLNYPSVERVRELFAYNPNEWFLMWKHRPNGPASWNSRYAETIAGKPLHVVTTKGNRVTVDRVNYPTANICWLHHFGEVITGIIDHKDRNDFNNSILNLRPATNSQNTANTKLNSNNTSGVKGVYWNSYWGKWVAMINIDGKKTYIGSSTDLEEAKQIRLKKAIEIYGEFYNAE